MVPPEWKTACLPHKYAVYRVGFFKKMHTCMCGVSALSLQGLWLEHCRIERETIAWLQTIEQMRERQNQARRKNLQKYAEFKRDQQQTSSPNSASFYE